MRMQAALHLIYPPQCLTCEAPVTTDFGLCSACWRETPFIAGLVCDLCGLPLPGDAAEEGALCDDCLGTARPWEKGRAALIYRDNARQLVLAFKHGDRQDLARPGAGWMMRAAAPILRPGMLVVPVPLHWFRLFRRRFNQSALLSAGIARLAGYEHCPDLLLRRKPTPSQEGRNRAQRFDNMAAAITVNRRQAPRIAGRHILLVDDVMTSGATLAAAAEACLGADAAGVSVLALARAVKEGF